MEVWKKEFYIPIATLSLHCDHQNDSCIKMGSDESHFNVSLTVRDKVTRQCQQTTTFEEKGEPKRIGTEAPLLTSLTPLWTLSCDFATFDETLKWFSSLPILMMESFWW